MEQESPRKSVVAVVGPEILGSLAVLALSLVIGLAALYFIALAHRNEQRGALADFSQMLSDEQLGAMQSENVRYHFLDAASDVVAVGDRLAPGDACLQFLGGKIRELHPDFDLPAAQDTIRRFCDNRGTHMEIEPLGQLNVVLALRPVHLENGMGADIVTFAVAPVPSPLVVREYPRLLTLVILVSLLWAGLAFRWIRASRRQLRDLAKRADIDGLTGALRRESFSENLEDPSDGQELATRSAIAELASSQADGTPLAPTAIAKLLELRTESGFPIGRNIQDTFMRGELEPTVLAGHRLVRWARQVLGFFGFAERLIASMRPLAFVTGHVDYCPWGTLAELLVRRGGHVVWYRMDCRLPIHILHHLDPTATLNGMIRRIERDAFSEFEHRIQSNGNLAGRVDMLAQARSAAVLKGVGRHFRWVAVDPLVGSPATPVPFLNSDLPNYCLFTHTFTDQPAADEALFVDHLEWVEETCRHAVATQSYNLIIKIHPLDRAYDVSGAADRLAAAFASAPNIHFTRDQIEPEELAKHCALGLTVRGTPGLEMSAAGLPMMLAGRGLYSDTGICLVPRTRAEYFALLAQGPPFPIDIATQSLRARRYMAFDRHWSAPMTELVPAFSHRTAADPNLWALIVDGINSACLETDQVARAIARSWSKGSAKVMVPELEGLLLE